MGCRVDSYDGVLRLAGPKGLAPLQIWNLDLRRFRFHNDKEFEFWGGPGFGPFMALGYKPPEV